MSAEASAASPADAGPLEGIRILDLSQGITGPYCTKLFADYGAEVTKIEHPGRGDVSRRFGPFPGDEPHRERSGMFLELNTGKRSVTLNLKTRSGRAILLRLAEQADLAVESFRPGHPRAARHRRPGAARGQPGALAGAHLKLRAARPLPRLRGGRHARLRDGRSALDHRHGGARAGEARRLRAALPRRRRGGGVRLRRVHGWTADGPRRARRHLADGGAGGLDGPRRHEPRLDAVHGRARTPDRFDRQPGAAERGLPVQGRLLPYQHLDPLVGPALPPAGAARPDR